VNSSGAPAPAIAVFAPRERARAFARAAFPRRRARVVAMKCADDLAALFRSELVDAAIVDLGAPTEETWKVAALAREFPSAPFFGVTALRAADGPGVARCAALDFADVLVESVDDGVARELISSRTFTSRFARALAEPPQALGLSTATQRATWRTLVAQAGRAVRTDALAKAVGVSREHLSRTFAAGGGPNLKRVIDLVRLVAAAELAKNPGLDVRDVARVLGFASASHLASTAQRVVGTKPASLARLRTVDLVERFASGRGRSRM
jgi:AraC-like DNA-binding protein